MFNTYDNHTVLAQFDLGIKPGQIIALSTLKQKLTEIESRFNFKKEDKILLMVSELKHLLIEEILHNDERRLVVKNSECIKLDLVASDNTTEKELIEKRIKIITSIERIYELRSLVRKKDISFEELENAIQKTADPDFLKHIIRQKVMPKLKIIVDGKLFDIPSFQIYSDWQGGEFVFFENLEILRIENDGEILMKISYENFKKMPIEQDQFLVVSSDKNTIEFSTLKLARSMSISVTVDLVRAKTPQKNYPIYRLVKIYQMNEILEKIQTEVHDFKEKLSYL